MGQIYKNMLYGEISRGKHKRNYKSSQTPTKILCRKEIKRLKQNNMSPLKLNKSMYLKKHSLFSIFHLILKLWSMDPIKCSSRIEVINAIFRFPDSEVPFPVLFNIVFDFLPPSIVFDRTPLWLLWYAILTLSR